MIQSKLVTLTLAVLSASTVDSAALAPLGARIGDSVINRLVIDPWDSNVLYATVEQRGVFKSTDQGLSWFAVNDGIDDVRFARSLAIDPQSSDTLYVGLDGVFKTINGGAWWSPTGPSGVYGILDIAIDPLDSSTIFAGGNGPFSYTKSTNGGISWSPSGGIGHVNSFAIDPRDSGTIYAGVSYGKIGGRAYKSIDGGDHWSLVNQGLPDASVLAVVIDHQNSNIVYAATSVISPTGGVYKSIDAGGQWHASLTDPATGLRAGCLAVDPRDSNTLYAGTYAWRERGRIFKTTDGGDSWYEADSGITTRYSTLTLAIDPVDSKIIYAGTGQGIFKSIDAGENWFAIGR